MKVVYQTLKYDCKRIFKGNILWQNFLNFQKRNCQYSQFLVLCVMSIYLISK
jgi:hypothetical protein